jgi:hypothetical protein
MRLEREHACQRERLSELRALAEDFDHGAEHRVLPVSVSVGPHCSSRRVYRLDTAAISCSWRGSVLEHVAEVLSAVEVPTNIVAANGRLA